MSFVKYVARTAVGAGVAITCSGAVWGAIIAEIRKSNFACVMYVDLYDKAKLTESCLRVCEIGHVQPKRNPKETRKLDYGGPVGVAIFQWART